MFHNIFYDYCFATVSYVVLESVTQTILTQRNFQKADTL